MFPLLGLAVSQWSSVEGRLVLAGYNGDLWDEPLDRGLNIIYALWTENMDPKQRAEFDKGLAGESTSAVNKERTGWDRGRAAAANATNPAIAEMLKARQATRPPE